MADALLELKIKNWNKFRLETQNEIGRFAEQSQLFEDLVSMAISKPKEGEIKEITDQLEPFGLALSTKNPKLASAIGQFCSLSKLLYVNPEFPKTLEKLKLMPELFKAATPSPQEKNEAFLKLKVQEWNDSARKIYDSFDSYTKIRQPLYQIINAINLGKTTLTSETTSALSTLTAMANQLSSKDSALANALNKFATISRQYLSDGKNAASFIRYAKLMPIMRSLNDIKRKADDAAAPKPEPPRPKILYPIDFKRITWRGFTASDRYVDFTFEIVVDKAISNANVEICLESPSQRKYRTPFRKSFSVGQTSVELKGIGFESNGEVGDWKVYVSVNNEDKGYFTIPLKPAIKPTNNINLDFTYIYWPKAYYVTDKKLNYDFDVTASQSLPNAQIQFLFTSPSGRQFRSQTYTYSFVTGKQRVTFNGIDFNSFGEAGDWKLMVLVNGIEHQYFTVPISKSTYTPPTPPAPKDKKASDSRDSVVGCVTLLIIAVLVWMFWPKSCSCSGSNTDEDATPAYYVIADNVVMRSDDSTNGAKVADLNFGDEFRYYRSGANGYSYGAVGSQRGYIKSDYLIESDDFVRMRDAIPAGNSMRYFAEYAKHRFAIRDALRDMASEHPDCRTMMTAPGKVVTTGGLENYVMSFSACDSTYTYVYTITNYLQEPQMIYKESTPGKKYVTKATSGKSGWKLKYGNPEY